MSQYAILILVILLIASIPASAKDQPLVGQPSSAKAMEGMKGVYSVASFGAKKDGKTNDTAAIQKALDAADKDGGGIVFLPTGNYMVKTHLSIPANVTLQGVFTAPTQGTQNKGTTLLAVEGKGKEDGYPFIMLHANSVLKGVTVFYLIHPEPVPKRLVVRLVIDGLCHK